MALVGFSILQSILVARGSYSSNGDWGQAIRSSVAPFVLSLVLLLIMLRVLGFTLPGRANGVTSVSSTRTSAVTSAALSSDALSTSVPLLPLSSASEHTIADSAAPEDTIAVVEEAQEAQEAQGVGGKNTPDSIAVHSEFNESKSSAASAAAALEPLQATRAFPTQAYPIELRDYSGGSATNYCSCYYHDEFYFCLL
jgi:cytoskeletal protein RodZ